MSEKDPNSVLNGAMPFNIFLADLRLEIFIPIRVVGCAQTGFYSRFAFRLNQICFDGCVIMIGRIILRAHVSTSIKRVLVVP